MMIAEIVSEEDNSRERERERARERFREKREKERDLERKESVYLTDRNMLIIFRYIIAITELKWKPVLLPSTKTSKQLKGCST